MAVTVRTFASSGEAAAALSSDRGARYLGGGTLVMRALNEGDVTISTIVRASDHALTRIDATGSRITIGAGVTFARILAERDLAFLHSPARSIGGPAVRNMGTVGGNLFAPLPYGDFTVALLALFGIADPNLYRTLLWQDGSDNGFNSNPNAALYAAANYRPYTTPKVWSQLYVPSFTFVEDLSPPLTPSLVSRATMW